MTDPTQAGQPSEEELRAYLEQLRSADPAEVLVQAYRMLGTGAEVKLGRPDARPLIDAMAALVEAVAGSLPADLARQMRDGVGQLQVAQVQAEREAAGQPGAGQPDGEAAGAGTGASQQGASQQGGQAPAGQGAARGAPGDQAPGGAADQRMTDRLWIPGRDPRPR